MRTSSQRRLCLLIASLAVVAAATTGRSAARATAPIVADHRNVVVILVDDATVDDVATMPAVQRLLVDRGTTFAGTYGSDPLCSPARASILTGRYPHNHRVLDNVAPLGGFTTFDDSSTIATWLDDDYRTGLFGKYLNDNADQGSYVPPGWDDFALPAHGDTYRYVSPRLSVNGSPQSFPGKQSTSVYSSLAQSFIADSVGANQPFFAYLSIVAPHSGGPHDDYPDDARPSPWVSPEYRGTEVRSLPDDPSVNESDVTDKPSYVQARPVLNARTLKGIAERDAQRREALRPVDDEVAAIVHQLSALGVLGDTDVVFASDNGFMAGQHRIKVGKSVAYEPAARVPLIIRGPDFPAGAVYSRVTGLQDIAPTVLGVAHERSDTPVDGVSLRRLANGTMRTDRPQLLEIAVGADLSDNAVERGARPSADQARRLGDVRWYARGFVGSNGWKYVSYPQTGETELYHLRADPFELDNLAADPVYGDRIASMAARLRAWQSCSGRTCR
jgi:N-acetylglucosamine-6-sulfatase